MPSTGALLVLKLCFDGADRRYDDRQYCAFLVRPHGHLDEASLIKNMVSSFTLVGIITVVVLMSTSIALCAHGITIFVLLSLADLHHGRCRHLQESRFVASFLGQKKKGGVELVRRAIFRMTDSGVELVRRAPKIR